VQQIEAHQHRRGRALRRGQLLWGLGVSAILQGVERRPALGPEHHDLGIEHHAFHRLSCQVLDDFGEERREIDATP
jgi:hypothetical protein